MYKLPTWLNVRGIYQQQNPAHALVLTNNADIEPVGSIPKMGCGVPPPPKKVKMLQFVSNIATIRFTF